jgi:hypothetical protein
MEAGIVLTWQFASVLNAVGWAAGWYLFAVAALLCFAIRTMYRFDVWLAHQYEVFAPLTVGDVQCSLDELVNSSVDSGRKWGLFGRFSWWTSCVIYGLYIVFYVFELAFQGFSLPFAISVGLNEGVIYNTMGLLMIVFASLVVRWRMKRWRLEGKWWATEPPL